MCDFSILFIVLPITSHCIIFRSFDLKLESFGVDLASLKAKTITRIFRCWVEEWEKECIKHNDPVSERKLLEKYKGMRFVDSDSYKVVTICDDALYWRKRQKGDGNKNYVGWHLNTIDEDGEEDVFQIDDDICQSISMKEQAEGIEIVKKDINNEDDGEDSQSGSESE